MSFDYDSKISKAVAAVPPSAIRKFFDLANEMQGHVISLSIGEPDFVTPWSIREAAINSIVDGYTHYSPNSGYIDSRVAIADYLIFGRLRLWYLLGVGRYVFGGNHTNI